MEGTRTASERLVFLDTETTGLDPSRHEVWEVGMIAPADDESVHVFLPVNLAEADSTALRIGGLYNRHPDPEKAWVVDGSGPAQELPRKSAVATIAKFVANAHLVGLNPAFDAAFLDRLFRRHDQAGAWHYHLVDVLALAAGSRRISPPWESKDLAAELGVDELPPEERHTALGDARWAKRMYEAVMSTDTRGTP